MRSANSLRRCAARSGCAYLAGGCRGGGFSASEEGGFGWLVSGCKKPLLTCQHGAHAGGKEHAGPGGPEGAGCIRQRRYLCAVVYIPAAGTRAACLAYSRALLSNNCIHSHRSPRSAQVAPGITPTLLERIVAARADLTKADIKEVSPFAHRCPCCSKHNNGSVEKILSAAGHGAVP